MPPQVSMPMTELLALPATFSIPTAGRAWRMGRHKANRLAREGEFPVPIHEVDGRRVCTRPELFRTLGMNPDGSHIQGLRPV